MARASRLIPRPATPSGGAACTVKVAPADRDDMLTVEWESVDPDTGAEMVAQPRVRWASNGRMPVEDDEAVLLLDNRGDAWALVTATGATFEASGAAALDARLDVLEARPRYTRGTDEAVFSPAGNYSITKTVAHGLGQTPTAVLVTSREGAGINYQATADATNLYIVGDYPYSALAGTFTFDWLAST
jgi:hypothetical protein